MVSSYTTQKQDQCQPANGHEVDAGDLYLAFRDRTAWGSAADGPRACASASLLKPATVAGPGCEQLRW
jgi:hypothetical protein